MDATKLINVYASTTFYPTDQEIQWVIDNIDVEKAYSNKWSHIQPRNQCDLPCKCENEMGDWEDIEIEAYKILLEENATDIPKEEWECEDGRELWILVCSKCKCWALCD